MIQKVEMYQAVCDRCGRPCAETSGIVAWETPESARTVALDSGWLSINHLLYCPDCIEYDEETGSYKPKEKRGLTMERKIGEIFQHKGEWYQCVECDSCRMCSLFCTECSNGTKSDIADEVFGICGKIRRRDYKNAIFKKLEKVGEPFTIGDKLYLHVKVFDIDSIDFCLNSNMNVHNHAKKTVTIELEQNQENMEENKQNLKPFDLEAAKAGKPVCTRDGRKARIICFDAKSDRGLHIIALVDSHDCKKELVYPYNNRGICGLSYSLESGEDLMMLSEKCERWVNVFKMPNGSHNVGCLYSTKEEAISHVDKGDDNYIATVKIEWEE